MKSILSIIISVVVIMLASHYTAAQTTVLDTVHTYTSFQNIERKSNSTVSDTISIQLADTFIKLSDGQTELEIIIDNIIGNWSDISLPGELTFEARIREVTGSGRFQRAGGQLSLILDFSDSSTRKNALNRKYIIQNPL